MDSVVTQRSPSLAEVKGEIQSVLGSRTFRQSRGLAKLLRYICTRALVEDSDPTTEYTIAVDVLGKPQEFKESKDSSVRVEVYRLRKRLAEFYEGEGAEHRIRIELPAGQYVPVFAIQENGLAPALETISVAITDDLTPVVDARPEEIAPSRPALLPATPEMLPLVTDSTPRVWLRPRTAILAVIGFLTVGGVLATASFSRRSDALDTFWRPVLASANPILLCVGNIEGGQRPRPVATVSPEMTLLQFENMSSKLMLLHDAETMARFTGLLEAKGKAFSVRTQSEATFDELQHSPAVLIGLANNDWTERLVGALPFTLEHDPPGKLVLRDRDHPDKRDWSVDYLAPYLSLTRDYALVVRVLDPKTEQMVVTAAGVAGFGTLAAGEFLTDPQQFKKIEAVAPAGWQKKNFELVLSTDVIRGKSGHPEIIASHFW